MMKKIFTLMTAVMMAISASAQTDLSRAITMQTAKLTGETVTLKLTASGTRSVWVDWGDGKTVQLTGVSGNSGSPSTHTGTLPVDNATINVYVDGCALTVLDCQKNKLTSLDVTGTSTLNYLTCNHNSLTELDVSTQGRLLILVCNNNQIASLDVSNNAELWRLYGWTNKLTSLTGLENTLINDLSLRENPLGSINVAGIVTLKALFIQNCGLSSLNLKGCIGLTSVAINNAGPVNANKFDACTLNAIYETLPSTRGTLTVVYNGSMAYDELTDVAGSNKTIATTKGWTVKSKGGATYTGDGGGCGTTGIDHLKTAKLRLSPNPAKDYTQLTIGEKAVGSMLYVYDMSGKVVLEKKVRNSVENLNISRLIKGVYTVVVAGDIQRLMVM